MLHRLFSRCDEGGQSLDAVHRLLTVVASSVVEHGALGCVGSVALEHRSNSWGALA